MFAATGVELSPQAIAVAVATLASTAALMRVVIRYDRTFIRDQDKEIAELRQDYGQVRAALRVAQEETEECLRDRRADRMKMDALERTVLSLQSQVEVLTLRVDRNE